MRTIILDQFEFDHWDSEEHLEISIAAKGNFPFPDVASFASAAIGVEHAKKLPDPQAYTDFAGSGNMRDYLKRYAAVTLPDTCDWPMYVIRTDPNDFDMMLDGPDLFIRYHWETSA